MTQTSIGKNRRLKTLYSSWIDCTRCPLSQLRKRIVPGTGSPNSPILMIGEAPGKDEDDAGVPFVGRAGHEFNKLLASVGLSRSLLYITNTCLCRPRINKPGKNNRKPHISEMRACFPRLQEEIAIVNPSIIVLAGNTPLQVATGKTGITKSRGWQDCTWTHDGTTIDKIYATLHPASLLYGSEEQKKKKKWMMFNDWTEIVKTYRELAKY